MRFSRGALSVLLLSFGCGGNAREDAGLDAGASDAGADTSVVGIDAPSSDAGSVDAATPQRMVEAAAMSLSTEVTSVTTLRDSIPVTTLESVETIDLDICVLGIDRLIGETGIQTLTLSDGAVRALADLEQASRLLALLQVSIDALSGSGDSDIMNLAAAATRMQQALLDYHASLVTLYRARLDEGLVVTPVIVTHTEHLYATSTNQPIRVDAIVEAAATSPNAQIVIECPVAVPSTAIEVRNEETGALLASGSTDVSPLVVPLAIGTTALQIDIDPLYRVSGETSRTCVLKVESMRTLRRQPSDYASPELDAASGFARGAYILALDTVLDARLVGTADPRVLDSVERVLTLMDGAMAPIWPLIGRQYPALLAVEDVQRTIRLYDYANAIVSDLLASPEIAGAEYVSIREEVTDMQSEIAASMTVLRSLP